MTSYLTPTAFSVGRAADYVRGANSLYFFVGDHRSGTSNAVADTVEDSYRDPWRQMIEGKLVTDVVPSIRYVPYEYGKVFAAYDDADPTLVSSDFYAVVNAGSFSHCFKCLYNDLGANSAVQPDFSQITGANSTLYQTSDGYRWKYMYSVDSATVSRFATADRFPLVPNAEVASAAVPGSISTMFLADGGKGYDNYVSGTFQASDVRVDSVPTLYQLSNSEISTANGFYSNCVLLITAGTGIGQFATITSFVSTNTGNFANVDSPFSVTPTNGSKFEVFPRAYVLSDGSETRTCVARALVNSLSSNSISSIEVLDPGAGYFTLRGAVVGANATVGVSVFANVRPILPPPGGHGSDAARELGATGALVSVKLANTEGGLIPATNSFREIGLVREPLFSNVGLTISGASGTYDLGEVVTFVTTARLATNVSSNALSTAIVGDSRANFLTLVPNTTVAVSNGTWTFLGTVAAVNSTQVTLGANSPFTGTGLTLSVASVADTGTVVNPVTSSNVFVTGLSGNVAGTYAYGNTSGSFGSVTGISRSGITKGFETFVQLHKYSITILGGSFAPDEVVTWGAYSGLVHSTGSGSIYISNQTGPISISDTLTGATSGAVGTVTDSHDPELIPGSGTIEYLERIEAVNRAPSETEQFVISYLF